MYTQEHYEELRNPHYEAARLQVVAYVWADHWLVLAYRPHTGTVRLLSKRPRTFDGALQSARYWMRKLDAHEMHAQSEPLPEPFQRSLRLI